MPRRLPWQHLVFLLVSISMLHSPSTVANAASTDDPARKLVAEHETDIRPLEIEVARKWWDANVSGTDEAFKAKETAETALDLKLSDRDRFGRIKQCRENPPDDKTLARQVEIMYLQALAKQVEPELLKQLVARANQIEKSFNVFRAKVDEKELTDSEVRKILKESRDASERKEVWEANKGVAGVVGADLLGLVRMRNEAAKKLGFKDYHDMQLRLNEQSQDQVLALFDELDALTKEPFAKVKADIDRRLAERYGMAAADLRPWHYQDPFFQEAPALYDVSLDAVYAQADILDLCRRFYDGIGLPIDDVLARSDLYEKPGKSPHAFCTDIDRAGDVRVLANVVPNEYWMSTMLHELGHAVYSSKNIPASVPYLLRSNSHILTTEGVAMQFERFSKSADWLLAMNVQVDDPAAFNETGLRMRRNHLLIFSRWCQVMFRFERGLYGDPDQDLNKLWWDLVEKYQLVHRPEGRNAPDYAAKIHIVSAPAYYHNYIMGELFACQVHRAICDQVLKVADPYQANYVGNKEVGEFMRQRVFTPGQSLAWNELTEFATGSRLSAKAFAAEFRE